MIQPGLTSRTLPCCVAGSEWASSSASRAEVPCGDFFAASFAVWCSGFEDDMKKEKNAQYPSKVSGAARRISSL